MGNVCNTKSIEIEITQMLLIEREQQDNGSTYYTISTEKKQVFIAITQHYVNVFAGKGVGTGKVFHHDNSAITGLAKAYNAYKCKHCRAAIHAVFAELTER